MPVIRHLRVGLSELIPDVVPDPRAQQTPRPRRRSQRDRPLTPIGTVPDPQDHHGTYPDQRIELRTHDGYEWLYVLSGRLMVGDHDLALAAGEAAKVTLNPALARPSGKLSRRNPQHLQQERAVHAHPGAGRTTKVPLEDRAALVWVRDRAWASGSREMSG